MKPTSSGLKFLMNTTIVVSFSGHQINKTNIKDVLLPGILVPLVRLVDHPSRPGPRNAQEQDSIQCHNFFGVQNRSTLSTDLRLFINRFRMGFKTNHKILAQLLSMKKVERKEKIKCSNNFTTRLLLRHSYISIFCTPPFSRRIFDI